MAEPLMETASWARRLGALIVDWAASTLVVVFVLGADTWSGRYGSVIVLGVYVVENALFTTLGGGSFGQLATRLRVVRVDGDPRPLDPLRSLARAIMIAVVIPPLVYRPDGRGLHDMANGSATVTLQGYNETYRARRRLLRRRTH